MAPIFDNEFGSVVDVSLSEEVSSFSFDGMHRLKDEDKEHILLKHKFYSSIVPNVDYHLNVVEIYRNMYDMATARARCGAFKLHLEAMAKKRGGNPNVRGGWFGTSRDRVQRIMSYGFGIYGMNKYCDLGGFGVNIFSELSALDSVLSSTDEEDGIRHVVYCRVILGNVKEVPSCTRRTQPSSENIDSGVDNLITPRKYIIWYPDANTHILPLYVLSIKMEPQIGSVKGSVKKPCSPWISLQALLSTLSDSLPPSTMRLIRRLHSDFMEKKISKQQLVFRVRQLTGDKLLVSAIKCFRISEEKVARIQAMSVADTNKEIDFLWIVHSRCRNCCSERISVLTKAMC